VLRTRDGVLVGRTRARILLAGVGREGMTEPPEKTLLSTFTLHEQSGEDLAVLGDAKAFRTVVLDGLEEKDAERLADFVRHGLDDPEPTVRATAAELVGAKGLAEALPDLSKAFAFAVTNAQRFDAYVRAAIATAAGKIATKPGIDPAVAEAAVALVRRALEDPAPTVRLAAREAAAETKLPDLVEASKKEDPSPNDWRGLPRPKVPVLGLDLTKGEPLLSEEEVLRLAAVVAAKRPRVVFDTDVGEIVFEVDAREAPVHAVNLVLLAAAHTYDGTPWHRVVPAFVIQGGDPWGDGSGDAGYSVPDEINRLRYVRGALGMPKSTKDTGGCQVFVMHCAYPPLDGNYTCFGRVVSGLDVVDRIRVGDRIRSARVVVPE
jgi:cyclophilin family peptidyl-prolyl cis-trans isomerase